jgi:predicted GTPase
VDPRAWAAPAIAATYTAYPHIGPVLPAVGYGSEQLEALRATIVATPADVVVASTPIDLAAVLELEAPVVRARYEFAETGAPTLASQVDAFLRRVV